MRPATRATAAARQAEKDASLDVIMSHPFTKAYQLMPQAKKEIFWRKMERAAEICDTIRARMAC